MSGLSSNVSVVVPTLNAARWLPTLFRQLAIQQPGPPTEVILVDSGSTDETLSLAQAEPTVKVISIASFTHGGARNLGIREASGDIVILMTQDAAPENEYWMRKLVAPLSDPDVAAVYSRQVPRDDASPMERFFLHDRFPAGVRDVRRHHGAGPPVYPQTFFSNVSSAARRDVWQRFPFDETLLMSEDQQFARDVLSAGMALVYEPSSVVLHSHTYTLWQTFKRYFDSVVAFRQLSRSHGAGQSAKLGRGTLLPELRYLARHYPTSLPYYMVYMGFKSSGVLAGHLAEWLPPSLSARCSLNPSWWRTGQLDKRFRNREDAASNEK